MFASNESDCWSQAHLPAMESSLATSFSHGAGTYANRVRTAVAVQQPTGSWTNGFGYDIARRLTNVAMSAGSFSYSYFAGSPSRLPVKILLPNTSYITNTYDSVRRLLSTT